MNTPLPPELVEVERAIEASRAALPEGLRERVLAAAAAAPRRPAAWFAVAVALAAAALLNLSSSASLPRPAAGGRAGCAPSLTLDRARCFPPPLAAE